ncbi:MAG TPA: TIGR03435 family protein [Bryobacteraceae bacterium]|nr:TIGR03435 family protein [Bryobacteraceae bacterium]
MIALLGAVRIHAQPAVPSAPVASPLAFEVASIKPTPPEFSGSRASAPSSGNSLSLRGMSLREVIQLAYTLPSDLVSGGPGWIEGARYDIEARAEGKASQQQRLEMLKTLLAERFKLTFHYESKEISSYVLTAGKDSPKLKERRPGDGGEPSGIRDTGSLHYVCRDTSMAWFARYLESTVLSRPVADKTGLSGTYDFELSWRPDDSQFKGRFAGSREAQSDLPDLFTALKDIGLRLETVKSPVQLLRIDHAEKPSEN